MKFERCELSGKHTRDPGGERATRRAPGLYTESEMVEARAEAKRRGMTVAEAFRLAVVKDGLIDPDWRYDRG